MGTRVKYRRILLKVSGEALMGAKEFGIESDILHRYALEISQVVKIGVEVGIVIGGGNIYRGVENSPDSIDKVTGDYMGMLATLINGLALQSALENKRVFTRLLSPIKMEEIAEPFIRRRAIRHLEKGRVVIFGAGTGNPYFTTDTAAALRAIEIGADAILKGTRVDGIYDCDPEKNPDANIFQQISYMEVLKRDLKIMDLTSITLCKENKMPIIVFNMNKKGNLVKIIRGEKVGSIVVPRGKTKIARRTTKEIDKKNHDPKV